MPCSLLCIPSTVWCVKFYPKFFEEEKTNKTQSQPFECFFSHHLNNLTRTLSSPVGKCVLHSLIRKAYGSQEKDGQLRHRENVSSAKPQLLAPQQHGCPTCGRIFCAWTGLISHLRAHRTQSSRESYVRGHCTWWTHIIIIIVYAMYNHRDNKKSTRIQTGKLRLALLSNSCDHENGSRSTISVWMLKAQ